MHRHPSAAIMSVLSIAILVAGSGGCTAAEKDEEAAATTTAALQAQSQAGLTDGILESEEPLAPEPEEAAQWVVDRPTRGLRPAGCTTKTRDGNVVTMKLDRCTGPFGKVVVEGELVATFSKTDAGVLHVEITSSEGTLANGHALTYQAQADIVFEGTERKVTYHGSSSGTTQRGRHFDRQTDLSIRADVATHCAQMDGRSTGSLGDYDVELGIEGLRVCRDTCPSAGVARATVSGPRMRDRSIEVRFDGSDLARVTIEGRGTREVDVALDCDAAEAVE